MSVRFTFIRKGAGVLAKVFTSVISSGRRGLGDAAGLFSQVGNWLRNNVLTSVSREIAAAVGVIVLIAAAAVGVSSCSSKRMSAEEASKWVAAFTPAHIDCDSKIRIELTDRMVAKIDTTRSFEGAFEFSSRVKGSVRCSPDKRYLDFIPAEALSQGKKYECRVKVKQIAAVDSLADFVFDFYVDKRAMRFEDVVATVDPDNVAMMCVRGRLVYNVAAGDSVTADSCILACDYPGARVQMDKCADKMSRGFKISGIRRQTDDRKMKVAVNPMGGFSNVEHEVTVPSVSDFRLLHANRVEAADPYLNLEFSAPLSSQQELDGLIAIDKIDNLRIERTGTNVKVFYGSNGIPDLTLRISELLKNSDGRCLDESVEQHFAQAIIPPAIETPFKGNILPDNNNLKLPFRAVNLAAVDVEVVKIFPANVMSFLQDGDLDYTSTLRRYGRLIYRRTVRLDEDPSLDLHRWQDFSIDLKNLFRQERGAVYNIRLTFRKAYSLYDKSKADDFELIEAMSAEDAGEWDENDPYVYRRCADYDGDKINWKEINDPSSDSYYMWDMDRMPEVNLVASDLGLMVKRADDYNATAIVTNLLSANPEAGVNVTAYNYQLQKIGSGVTDANGFVDFNMTTRPYLITASDGKSTTYLKVTAGRCLSTSNFDVSGKKNKDGIKGFVYGERGVWRPGDDVHLTLIVEDSDDRLPDNHPVVMEIYNPSNQLYARQTLTDGADGFYAFTIPTEESVATGMWTARFKVGNEVFTHPVQIETIKPNRLKINIESPDVIQADKPVDIGLNAHWLSGPVARNLSSSLMMTLYPNPTPFAKYKTYTFRNPLVDYTSSERSILSGVLDADGVLRRECRPGADLNAPGMLQANITARVTEPGGDASISARSVQMSPFGVYVGVDLSKNTYATGTDISIPVVALNQEGSRMKERKLDYKIYSLGWNWWWEGDAKALSRFVSSSTAEVVASGTVNVVNGHGTIGFKVEDDQWGHYLVLVRDSKGGHASGGVIELESPSWSGQDDGNGAKASSELTFSLDKQQYNVGDNACVYLPKCRGGKVLVSIENGSRVVRKQWVRLSAERETKFEMPVEKDMAPNFYVSATLLRPHSDTDFDTPIRLFGVRSATVIDPQSILTPVIEMPDELHPQQRFDVKVSEKSGRPMTYTLAIVDEGLLDITNFRTPRPWVAMNQREALGVNTWDMFDDVIGSFGANFRSVLSIGGDEALRKAAGAEKRFNPAVVFMGPFTSSGGAMTHHVALPNYVGSVRVMVVAAHQGAYGHADKTVKVISPVMMLSTLPRQLANGDSLEMPVTLLSMDAKVRNVSVRAEVDGPIAIEGSKSRTCSFAGVGEGMVRFRLVCDKSRQGRARVVLTATGGGHTCRDTTYIDVSNPMPIVVESVEKTLAGGRSATFSWNPKMDAQMSLQVASMPMPNFGGADAFMENYPHMCSEQLSSKLLFMLYGRKFLNTASQQKCECAMPQIIRALQGRQRPNGGFCYWPGCVEPDEWVTSLAGIALYEASRQGYRVDRDGLEQWRKYQRARSSGYQDSGDSDLSQAFRLYSMALAETPLTSDMNRLRESKRVSRAAAFTLASAYAEMGRKDVAGMLIERAERTEPSICSDIFDTPGRNDALELDAYALSGRSEKALKMGRRVAATCSSGMYVTQDVALSSMAFSHLAVLNGGSRLTFKVDAPGAATGTITDNACLRELAVNPGSGKVSVTNLNTKGALNLSLRTSYRPSVDKMLKASANGLRMTVKYVDMKDQPIDVSNMKQDTEFCAVISVSNLGADIENMALSYAVPSGWEIWNSRLYPGADRDSVDYYDLRDGSVNYYFDLRRGATKMFRVRMRAAYAGNYLLPPAVCEDMYNPACRAIGDSRRVSVI